MVAIVAKPPAAYKVGTVTRHIDALKPYPDNPRDEIDPKDPKILHLADSIEQHGIIEPLVITPDDVIIAGHRRRVAARVAAERSGRGELMIVPVTIREIKLEAALELILHENMQRESLTPLEEARALKIIMERRKLTLVDLARVTSLPSNTVSQRLAILKLEPEVQRLYGENELPLGAAPLLARVALSAKQISYAGLLARRQITLHEFKKAVEKELAAPPPEGPVSALGGPRPASAQPVPVPSSGGQKQAHPRGAKRAVTGLGSGDRLSPTRAEAMASLLKVLNRRISLVSVKTVIEAVCCSCGMSGQEEVCRSCPLPRVILGIAGRSDY